MEVYMKKDMTNDAVNRIQRKSTLRFMHKVNRDKAYELVKKVGLKGKKSTSRGQRIHPEYLEDYSGEIETGFGNSMYQSYFAVIYNLEVKG